MMREQALTEFLAYREQIEQNDKLQSIFFFFSQQKYLPLDWSRFEYQKVINSKI